MLIGKSCQVSGAFEKDIQTLKEHAKAQVETLQQDKEFQSIVAELEAKLSSPLLTSNNQSLTTATAPAVLYAFVSFSLGETALLNLAKEATLFDVVLVLRGFKDNSHRKTVNALQKIIQKTGQGFIIDPELFEMFWVESVPTYILSYEIPYPSQDRIQTPLHDRLKGYVSLHYALERFAKEGDLKNEAMDFLEKRWLK